MKIGDLVQSNIFVKTGSGPYGLVIERYPTPGYWNISWTSTDWDLSYGVVGMYEVHEKDVVVVSEA
tara:strand:- start:270 stop:467 length:198 start_codon:yes stop_codon:yes gene_type:complete